MKPTPLLNSNPSDAKPITRHEAATLLRHERKHGKIWGWQRSYLLSSRTLRLTCPKPPKPLPPPEPFALSMRLTYRYHQGYAHLDKWHEMGEARIVRVGKSREDHESFRETRIIEVDLPSKYRVHNVIRALRETMSFGCRCEHDCCGHLFGGPSKIRHLCGNRYAVIIAGYRNI